MDKGKYAELTGMTVSLQISHHHQGPFRQCFKCGSVKAEVLPGMSTHPGRLRCSGCGRHLTWLGQSHMDALLASAPRKKGAA